MKAENIPFVNRTFKKAVPSKIIYGDLIQLAKQNYFDAIIHGCNCFNNMEKGIAKQIKDEFPEAYEADNKTKKGDKNKLGNYTFAKIPRYNNLIIINAYTQYYYGGPNDQIQVDYSAVRHIFELLNFDCGGLKFAYPRIGAGLAKGDWHVISNIINEEFYNQDHTLVEWRK